MNGHTLVGWSYKLIRLLLAIWNWWFNFDLESVLKRVFNTFFPIYFFNRTILTQWHQLHSRRSFVGHTADHAWIQFRKTKFCEDAPVLGHHIADHCSWSKLTVSAIVRPSWNRKTAKKMFLMVKWCWTQQCVRSVCWTCSIDSKCLQLSFLYQQC